MNERWGFGGSKFGKAIRAVAGGTAAVALVAAISIPTVNAVCVSPPGDINGSGKGNVADALCAAIVASWQVLVGAGGGDPATPPACLDGPIYNADANCDGLVTVSDAILTITVVLGNDILGDLDSDPKNGCVDVCESVNLPGPPVVVPAFVHGVSTGGGLRLQALGTGASATGTSSGTVGGQNLNLEPHPVAK